jgi:hypothetical protein
MSSFTVVCFWAPLSVTEVARRWFTLPGSLFFIVLAAALIVASIAFWRSIWSTQSDVRLLQLAVAMTVFGTCRIWRNYLVLREAALLFEGFGLSQAFLPFFESPNRFGFRRKDLMKGMCCNLGGVDW